MKHAGQQKSMKQQLMSEHTRCKCSRELPAARGEKLKHFPVFVLTRLEYVKRNVNYVNFKVQITHKGHGLHVVSVTAKMVPGFLYLICAS